MKTVENGVRKGKKKTDINKRGETKLIRSRKTKSENWERERERQDIN